MTQDDDTIYVGGVHRVVAVTDLNGRCVVKEFLDLLRAKHQRAYAEFRARIERLGDTGMLRTPEQMRRIVDDGSPPVYEIKAHSGRGWRLYVIREGTTWYATHGRGKPKDSGVVGEAKKARRLYGERRA